MNSTETPAETTRRVSDAITSALLHVAACASARLTDPHGEGLAIASKTARMHGASHAQVVTAMRGESNG